MVVVGTEFVVVVMAVERTEVSDQSTVVAYATRHSGSCVVEEDTVAVVSGNSRYLVALGGDRKRKGRGCKLKPVEPLAYDHSI